MFSLCDAVMVSSHAGQNNHRTIITHQSDWLAVYRVQMAARQGTYIQYGLFTGELLTIAFASV